MQTLWTWTRVYDVQVQVPSSPHTWAGVLLHLQLPGWESHLKYVTNWFFILSRGAVSNFNEINDSVFLNLSPIHSSSVFWNLKNKQTKQSKQKTSILSICTRKEHEGDNWNRPSLFWPHVIPAALLTTVSSYSTPFAAGFFCWSSWHLESSRQVASELAQEDFGFTLSLIDE